MRLGIRALVFALTVSGVAFPQSNSAAGFLAQLLAKYPAMSTVHSVTLNGGAQWTAGSLHESGTASLEASNDGSSTLQLVLGTANRAETRTALGSSRSCQWTDAHNAVHAIQGPDCEMPVTWFAPTLLTQSLSTLTSFLSVSDDGSVTRNGVSLHQLSYAASGHTRNAAAAQLLSSASKVSVLYDPQTLLPASIEYSIHADNDLRTAFKVRVVYSDYQTESGLPIPHRIDRYVNNTLQLSITVTGSSLN